MLIETLNENEIRIGHAVSCFLFGHEYESTGTREGHNEYVCLRCGHPLLFEKDDGAFAGQARFVKKVRYLCNLFGHRVHEVTRRHGYTEYACGCGHSFLRPQAGLTVVRHPPICTLAGHFIRFVEMRGSLSECVCRNCGHTFLFSAKKEVSVKLPNPLIPILGTVIGLFLLAYCSTFFH